MAVQNPFFGKRDTDTFSSRNSMPGTPSTGSASVGSSSLGSAATGAASVRQSAVPAVDEGADAGGSKLTVGPNIKLRGVEITDCDTLVVEGTVEATMNSRVIKIAEQGAFHGTAEIDIAEIHGVFDGTLTVRHKLVIYGTGKVSGKIRYGKLVVEEGGELSGQIEAGVSARTATARGEKVSGGADAVAKPAPAAAAGSASTAAMTGITPSFAA